MIKIVDSVIWSCALILIVFSCFKLSIYLGFVQFRFGDIFKNINGKTFSSLLLSLGGRIGVGSIAGCAIAIKFGGIGSVFWMMIVGVLTTPLLFSEVVLGMKYKENGVGGPAHYISKGLGLKKLSVIFAFLMFFCFLLGTLSIQANTIVITSSHLFDINIYILIGLLCLITFIVINGGIKKIIKFMNVIVPIMIIIYLFCLLYFLILQINCIADSLIDIISSAFNFKSFMVGSVLVGVQRGLFACETGLGTSAITGSSINYDVVKQGFVQMLSSYFISFFVCFLTGLVIVIYGDILNINNGVDVILNIFYNNMGNLGIYLFLIIIVLFAFSSILTAYYSAFSNSKLIFNKSVNIKYFVLIIIIFGGLVKADILWEILNIISGLLVIINVFVVFKLRKNVKNELNKYDKNGKM